MPERQRQDTHQRAIAQHALLGRSRFQRWNACVQPRQRPPCLDPNVEDTPIYGEIALAVPAHEPPPEILCVEVATGQQRVEEAERLCAIVRPRAWRRPLMRPRKV